MVQQEVRDTLRGIQLESKHLVFLAPVLQRHLAFLSQSMDRLAPVLQRQLELLRQAMDRLPPVLQRQLELLGQAMDRQECRAPLCTAGLL